MNRQANTTSLPSPGRNLRLGALVLAFIAISQIEDPLVNATLTQEVVYWCVRLVTLATGLWVADVLVSRWFAERWGHPAWLKPVVVVSIIALLPFSIAEVIMERQLPMRPEFVDDDLFAVSPVLAWLTEYGTVLSIFLPVHLLLWLVIDRPALVGADHTDAASSAGGRSAPTPLPEFLQKSSVTQLDAVLALQAEEHYVRVFTAEGSELVLCRFKDAVEAMPKDTGLRVHRSWWLADTAVRSAKRGTRRWQLVLRTGDVVPVSDSYVSAVRDRGLLKRKAASPS
ncbi:MAG: LytTR family DNA-binding domain-containing protein [Pseudomonadota bacterium]